MKAHTVLFGNDRSGQSQKASNPDIKKEQGLCTDNFNANKITGSVETARTAAIKIHIFKAIHM